MHLETRNQSKQKKKGIYKDVSLPDKVPIFEKEYHLTGLEKNIKLVNPLSLQNTCFKKCLTITKSIIPIKNIYPVPKAVQDTGHTLVERTAMIRALTEPPAIINVKIYLFL